MSVPQPALFTLQSADHLHAQWQFEAGLDLETVRQVLASARAATQTVGGPNVVWGYRPSLWRQLSGNEMPASVHDFTGVGLHNSAQVPVGNADVWLWLSGDNYPGMWRLAQQASRTLGSVAHLVDQQHAYKAQDSRDSIGFIDGTENPGAEVAAEVAIFPESTPGAGGSAVLVQKWIHNLEKFESLPLAAQERVIGRTKADSIELPAEQMPRTSHVSRNVITDPAGDELKIFRLNTPFADASQAGTMFIGATAFPERIETMLARMFNAGGDGLHDALTDFSTPVSGDWFFVPSLQDLGRFLVESDANLEAEVSGATAAPEVTTLTTALNIGSLVSG